MLNLSNNSIKDRIDTGKYKSFSEIKDYKAGKIFTRLLLSSFLIVIIVLFLPWTQNIRSKGYVTTLQLDQRPQTIHSIIAGRIEKWNVREGDYVKKGDTILFISEIKDEYFDPELLERTSDQITSKEQTLSSYLEKVKALDLQIEALQKTKTLKIKQAKNYIQQTELKVLSDSIDYVAAINHFDITHKRMIRMEQLHKEGLKSLTDLEGLNLKLQEANAKKISAESKLLTSKNKLINAEIELNSIEFQYRDKISKARSDKYTALSDSYDTEAMVTKMKNQYTNYSVRTGYYYITSPQEGYITKTIRSGIGETIKEGEELVSLMPALYDYAVSMYIKPMNLPLINIGQPVRFMFDGWPSVVFSGWPNLSYGTFGGEVVAIDNFISENGLYRILVAPGSSDEPWPDQLRVGSGANGMALLKDVPIWYELWRNLNGFPPDYYTPKPNPGKTK